MKIIVGLGNPGARFSRTRHNIGWRVLMKLASLLPASDWKKSERFKAYLSEATFLHEKIILVRPLTYMNESGQSAANLQVFYKISAEDIWVICDDVDLPLGRLRIRTSGSAGTHHGLRSVVGHLRSEKFPRFRLGIGPEKKVVNLERFVLQRFTASEEKMVADVVERTAEAVLFARRDGFPAAMNRFHKK